MSGLRWDMWLALAFLVLGTLEVWAHEIRPAYLEIAESSPGRFDILWKMPALGGAMLPLRPVLPEACPRTTALLTYEMPDAVIQRWTIRCGEKPLAGQPVAIEGLSANLIDVLVRIAFADGTVITQLLSPSVSSFVVAGKE